ncbi:hypothetical protein LADH09A_004886 [Micromonospora sp. LAH09]|uniref:hypothetical protein n=1 Tax=Micromonospora cabrerizensis TaxID=2911213 RepID=UPI001EE8ADE1|nr:hypothetical protein [Micromonospora cabrerizensis]MCG5470914.1 hypothetical protein [Micromonospora cabrerizensis]
MLLKAITVALVPLAGLAAIIWIANWPFHTPWAKKLSPEQRRINLAHNQRHHRRAVRVVLPMLAIVLGMTSVSILASPRGDPFAATVMGACSVVCAGVFVAVIRKGRRRP